MYYATTRRVKLEKVITFLNRKSVGDANRNRVGNLQVTLAIVSSLIEKCSDNLNVFAEKSVAILTTALRVGGLNVAKSVLNTYQVLCQHLDGGLFAGDKRFVEAFIAISDQMVGLGAANRNAASQKEWQMLSLISVRSLSYCLSYSPKVSLVMLKKVLALLIETFRDCGPENALHHHLSNDESIKLSKIQSKRTLKAEKQIEEDLENDIVDNEDLYQESVVGLKAIFNTSMVNQISEATDSVVQYTFGSSKYTSDWSETFLQLCTAWVPVQLRFVVLNTLVSKLSGLLTGKNVELQKAYANHIEGLVSSRVNMIGLSISDLIESLLGLKQLLYFNQSLALSDPNIKDLSEAYSNSIVNLSTHIYYYDQVPDSVYEIFLKIESTLRYSDNKSLYAYIMSLLQDIDEIFNKLDQQSSKSMIARNHIGIEQWQVSLSLLIPKPISPVFNHISEQQTVNIQIEYLKVFKKFLQSELVQVNDGTPDEIEIGQTPIVDKFSDPDFNQLISESTNFLSHYLVNLDKYLNNNPLLDLLIVQHMIDVTFKLCDIFAINFLSNFIPFYFHWTLKEFDEDLTTKDLAKDTFAQAVLKRCLSLVDEKYEEELSNYSKSSKLYSNLTKNCEFRVTNGFWVQEIVPYTNTNSVTEYQPITSDLVEEYANKNEFLSKWINAQKLLILSILPDDLLNGQHSGTSNNNGINLNTQNGNGHVHVANGNGHLDPNITIESRSSSRDFNEVKPGLGLGTTADIASIHSGLRNTTFDSSILHNNSYEYTNGSIMTNDKLRPPKVSDLKGMLNEYSRKPSSLNETSSVTPGSVLSKQMVTHDVDSILEGLDDDDSFIV